MSSKNYKKKTIGVFLQARIKSTRLPGKLLKPLCDKSVLKHIIERVESMKKSYNYLAVLVPESDLEEIQIHLKDYPEVIIISGDAENVLKRYYNANLKINADIIVRISGDNPLLDIQHLKRGLLVHQKVSSEYTYYDNLALGTGFEIFNREALEKCFENSTKDYQFEHVTPYMREYSELFKTKILRARGIFNNPSIRLTIDVEADYQFVKKVFENLYKNKPIPTRQVLRFLHQNPSLLNANSNIKQRRIPGISFSKTHDEY